MRRTKIVHGTNQIHSPLDAPCASRRAACAPSQNRQTTSERAIQPLDERRVEHLASWRRPQLGQEDLHAPQHQSMPCTLHSSSIILLDHLGQRDLGPGVQPWSPARSRLSAPKGLTHDIDVRFQPIGHNQQRTDARTADHNREQAREKGPIAVWAERAAKPQSSTDHQCERHPQHTRLGSDMHFVGLNLPQIAQLNDLCMMQRLGMRSGDVDPLAYGLGLQREGGLNRRDGTAIGNQGQHLRDDLFVGTPAKERCTVPGAKRLGTDQAAIALAFLAMNANIPVTDLPACRTSQVGAKCRLRIDGTPPFGLKHRRVSSDPLLFSSPIQ